ncbi:hypothetical protein RO3G_09286 [Rhizopus delemar RA 99-880]|uniref:Uncharacterized protein n=1 Tax=Rhizopus delemar (strain RA 99-880 / ATCC MYA-4621 / FGSC 9543 / NRRL 43880) TaxID=246409 RepID=I1C7Z6_RHIO9|nr:hypothetical protein RO3G_09286 [Rhizopus delemar RA 99-880]|eukprot:EIE84576.1 hypothetical protein RO3G_09286 [Rhizopus delemar RA 99-880]
MSDIDPFFDELNHYDCAVRSLPPNGEALQTNATWMATIFLHEDSGKNHFSQPCSNKLVIGIKTLNILVTSTFRMDIDEVLLLDAFNIDGLQPIKVL